MPVEFCTEQVFSLFLNDRFPFLSFFFKTSFPLFLLCSIRASICIPNIPSTCLVCNLNVVKYLVLLSGSYSIRLFSTSPMFYVSLSSTCALVSTCWTLYVYVILRIVRILASQTSGLAVTLKSTEHST